MALSDRLPSKLQSFKIRKQGIQVGEWLYTFKVNNLVSELGQVNYGSAYDEAVDGTLRHNFRGFRLTITLDFAKLNNATVDKTISGTGTSDSTFQEFLNDVTAALTGGDQYVDFAFDTFDTDTWRRMVIDAASLRTVYTNQIGRASASITLVGQQILTTIPDELIPPSV